MIEVKGKFMSYNIFLIIYTASKVKHWSSIFLLEQFSNYDEEVLVNMENLYLL